MGRPRGDARGVGTSSAVLVTDQFGAEASSTSAVSSSTLGSSLPIFSGRGWAARSRSARLDATAETNCASVSSVHERRTLDRHRAVAGVGEPLQEPGAVVPCAPHRTARPPIGRRLASRARVRSRRQAPCRSRREKASVPASAAIAPTVVMTPLATQFGATPGAEAM